MTAADRWLKEVQKEAEKTLSCSNPECACFDEHLAVERHDRQRKERVDGVRHSAQHSPLPAALPR